MTKQVIVVALLALVFGGLGSSALLTRASAQAQPSWAVQQEKRIGPTPTPVWYWRWIHWRLHDRKGHRLDRRLRPKDAPHRVPRWAWRRLHFFLLARAELADKRKRGGQRKQGAQPEIKPARSNPTTRPSFGPVHFDGRARQMGKLYSVGVDDQGQSPSLWTCLCFEKNDLSLQPDASYGQVFKATVAVGDSNPWNTAAAATSGAGQLSVRRKNNLGKWDWYASAFKVPAWSGALSDINFVNLLSVGYQTSSKDQVGLGLMNNHGTLAWQIHQNSGYANAPSGAAIGSVNYRIPLLPVNYGHWQEFVVGVKWATDNTGAVEVYSRTAGGSWTHVFEKLNEPTYLYGTTPYGTFAKDGSNWGTVIDKIGLYFGALNGAKPTETVYESGLTRASDLATAQSILP
jgi:hypothetical protein